MITIYILPICLYNVYVIVVINYYYFSTVLYSISLDSASCNLAMYNCRTLSLLCYVPVLILYYKVVFVFFFILFFIFCLDDVYSKYNIYVVVGCFFLVF